MKKKKKPEMYQQNQYRNTGGRTLQKAVMVIFAIAFASVFCATGCMSRPVQQDKNTVQIALTARAEMQYNTERFKKGMEMAIAEYTGERHVVLSVFDGAEDFEESLETDTNLAQNPNVTAVVSLQDYEEIDAAAKVMDENHKTFFAMEGYFDETAENGYATFFPFSLNAQHLGYSMGLYLQKEGLKQAAVIHSGTPFEVSQANAFEMAAIGVGARTVTSLSEPATVQELDYMPKVMQALHADVLYLPYYRSYWAADILVGIRKKLPQTQQLANFTIDDEDTAELLRQLDGTVFPAFYPIERTDAYAQWAERYQKMYGQIPENQAAQGYDVVNLILKNYDGDNATLAQAIRSNAQNAGGIAGQIVYDLINGLPEITGDPKDAYGYEYLVAKEGRLIPID